MPGRYVMRCPHCGQGAFQIRSDQGQLMVACLGCEREFPMSEVLSARWAGNGGQAPQEKAPD